MAAAAAGAVAAVEAAADSAAAATKTVCESGLWIVAIRFVVAWIESPFFGRAWPARSQGSHVIAKHQNTFAKRQREQEKKRRAEDKQSRRDQRKIVRDAPPAPVTEPSAENELAAKDPI